MANDDFDTPWKEALTRYLPEFLAFFFPKAHAAIDWQRPHTFLDQELAQVVRDASLGKRLVDRLVQVTLTASGPQWIYIHIEVQGQRDANFAERLFTYNYRIYDRYHRPVATLALLADEQANWRPNQFGYDVLDCRHYLEFPMVKLLDYAPQLDTLLTNPNPFALVTAAHLLTQQTRQDPQARYEAKWRLAKLLYQRNWRKQQVIDLFAIIDWLLHLPATLERQLWVSIEQLERNVNMPYVTSVEKIGRQAGHQEGLQEGRQKGLQEGESYLLRQQLIYRFGDDLPKAIEQRLAEASTTQLEIWGRRLLQAQSVAEVFGDSLNGDTPH